MVRLLSGPPQAVPNKGTSLKEVNKVIFQVDSQNLRNIERDLLHQNNRLAKNKRAAEDV